MDYDRLSAEELVTACVDSGDTECWQAFLRRFHRVITVSVLRVVMRRPEAPRSLVEDLVQESYSKLCANRCQVLRGFRPSHPDAIYGFLKVLAINVAQDYFRAQGAEKRGQAEVHVEFDSVEEPGTPAFATEMERNILLEQIDRALTAAGSGAQAKRDQLVFWLYYRQGLTAAAIAALPGIDLTVKGVESALLRLTRIVREALKAPPQKASATAPERESGGRRVIGGEGL
jgi:RNA polymerase sigma-70 factor (ECF subfamily)